MASAWNVPRPAVRLALALALGILGALLLPAREEFFANPFASCRGTTPIAWISVALAGVLLLHRVENVKVPRLTGVFLGLALAWSLLFPSGWLWERWESCRELGIPDRFVWLCLLCLVLLVAGASVSGLRFQRRTRLRSCLESLVRGSAIALAAPLLLFASRPAAGSGSSSPGRVLSRTAFAVFLYASVAGCTLPHHFYALGMVCLSFSVWAWLGCALLFLLSPWPEEPRLPRPRDLAPATIGYREPAVTPGLLSSVRKAGILGVAAVIMAVVLVLLAWLDHDVLRRIWGLAASPFFLPEKLGCALLLLMIPWPEFRLLPKLGELPKTRTVNPLGTAVFLAMPLVPLAAFVYKPFLYVVSGSIVHDTFDGQFDRNQAGFVWDQPTIGKWLSLFTLFSAVVFFWVAVARWMSARRTRFGYWAFTVPTAALCVCLLTILTLPFSWLLDYVYSMGVTPKRLLGLMYALGGYAVVVGFFRWAVWDPKEGSPPHGP